MFAAPRIVDTSTQALHSHVIVVSDGVTQPPLWRERGWDTRTREGHGMAQQENPKDWLGAEKRLSRHGIETLGDLGRLAEARGVDAALRLVAEAGSRTG